jgi:hypothetical protein
MYRRQLVTSRRVEIWASFDLCSCRRLLLDRLRQITAPFPATIQRDPTT